MDSEQLEDRVQSLESEVDALKKTVESLEDAVGNAVTGEQLERAKSDLRSELIWKFVTWNVLILFGIFGIIGVVVAVLAYFG